jgi:hypothetical protein
MLLFEVWKAEKLVRVHVQIDENLHAGLGGWGVMRSRRTKSC